jgi:hypothetical protein
VQDGGRLVTDDAVVVVTAYGAEQLASKCGALCVMVDHAAMIRS